MNPLVEGELLELLSPAALCAGQVALDLGGGRGDLSRLLAGRFGCRVVLVDASPAACEAARERTRGLDVEVHTLRAEDYLSRSAREARPDDVALAAVLGAVHAFGPGLDGHRSAFAALAPRARFVLLADAVALGPRAAQGFEVASAAELDALFHDRVVSSISLGPDRMAAYERAWCDNLAAYLAAHPGDPREDWARERLAWSTSPKLSAARAELGFRALVLHTRA